MKKKQSETFHLLPLQFNVSDYFGPEGVNFPAFIKHENNMVAQLIEDEDSPVMKELRSRNFDVGWSVFLNFEPVIIKKAGASLVKWGTYLLETPLIISNNNPNDLSSMLPFMHPWPELLHAQGERALLTRFINYMSMGAFQTIFNHVFYPPTRYLNLESRALMDRTFNDIITGDGFYGISEVKQEA